MKTISIESFYQQAVDALAQVIGRSSTKETEQECKKKQEWLKQYAALDDSHDSILPDRRHLLGQASELLKDIAPELCAILHSQRIQARPFQVVLFHNTPSHTDMPFLFAKPPCREAMEVAATWFYPDALRWDVPYGISYHAKTREEAEKIGQALVHEFRSAYPDAPYEAWLNEKEMHTQIAKRGDYVHAVLNSFECARTDGDHLIISGGDSGANLCLHMAQADTNKALVQETNRHELLDCPEMHQERQLQKMADTEKAKQKCRL